MNSEARKMPRGMGLLLLAALMVAAACAPATSPPSTSAPPVPTATAAAVKPSPVVPATPAAQASPAGQAASGNKVEDAYVELLAQTTYHKTNNQNGWTAQNDKDLFAKYGVTQEEVDAFSKALRNDPAHAKVVTLKQLQRLQELQKTGN
ncbi:MAG: hypothetical protein Q7R39_03485 [Dehalococcoidia bacterium]|nr:hypothetical protein [Dehalococcoidia bacterium]